MVVVYDKAKRDMDIIADTLNFLAECSTIDDIEEKNVLSQYQ